MGATTGRCPAQLFAEKKEEKKKDRRYQTNGST
jgi:hypothetical protein